MIKIEKNVPVPSRQKSKGRSKYRLDEMKVGDSVKTKKSVQTMCAYVYNWKKRAGRTDMEFTARTEGKGCRVWRVA